MTGRVLAAGLPPAALQMLQSRYDALVLPAEADRDGFLAEYADEVTVAVTTSLSGVDAGLMARLPKLGAVVNLGVGYDAIDVGYAAEHGIVVSNTPDVSTDCVADTAVGLLIDTLRRFPAADRFVRDGLWPGHQQFPPATKVSGRRVGILGLGRIGSAIATRLTAFGCPITYHSRRPVPGVPYAYAESPADLARAVEVLVVAVSGGAGTENMVDRTVIEALGPKGYLINVARGSVVDEQALIDSLSHGRLAGAGLDVHANEPYVPQVLRETENVVLLPHVGSATGETQMAMLTLGLRNLDSYLSDGTLLTPVPETAGGNQR
ncbi:2-hydroxyacid dehydrogenase [Streptomyces sp. NPDC101234]|uniref:2-hydroxyacid dehydrogenase n=1 Tax=Streptomyces sp. NPDC101234 TaxID=3366138 RepID=UPI0037FE3097